MITSGSICACIRASVRRRVAGRELRSTASSRSELRAPISSSACSVYSLSVYASTCARHPARTSRYEIRSDTRFCSSNYHNHRPPTPSPYPDLPPSPPCPLSRFAQGSVWVRRGRRPAPPRVYVFIIFTTRHDFLLPLPLARFPPCS